MSNQQNIVANQLIVMAENLNMNDIDEHSLYLTLKNTVFKGADDDQLASLMIVANQYGLNPFTKEIYAFSGRGGITPVVSVDGWARIINDNHQCDGIQFEQDNESCTCKIYRKDRTHPTVVTEWLDECRGTSEPWKKYPKRMLRHKALIQCARVAFGFSGIYDADEAERIDKGGAYEQPIKDVVEPLDSEYESFKHHHLVSLENVAETQGTADLQVAYQDIPKSEYKTKFWTENGEYLKGLAQKFDAQVEKEDITDVEPITA